VCAKVRSAGYVILLSLAVAQLSLAHKSAGRSILPVDMTVHPLLN